VVLYPSFVKRTFALETVQFLYCYPTASFIRTHTHCLFITFFVRWRSCSYTACAPHSLTHSSPLHSQDLSRTVGREVAKMDSTMSCFAPSVYGYRPKVPTGLSGAFGSTASPMQQQQQQHTQVLLSKVEIPFTPNMGLFHE
jgi:hypothetical protein